MTHSYRVHYPPGSYIKSTELASLVNSSFKAIIINDLLRKNKCDGG